MKYHFIFLVMISFSLTAQANAIEARYQKSNKSAYIEHTVAPKQTLYSISKHYSVELEALKAANQLQGDGLRIGQALVIPWNADGIEYTSSHDKDQAVYYYAQRKDNLFRICRRYFDRQIDAVMRINGMKNRNLDLGQKILLGYLPFHAKSSSAKTPSIEGAPLPDVSTPITTAEPATEDKVIEDDGPAILTSAKAPTQTFSLGFDRGAAFWDKDGKALAGAYVLHRHAQPNTWIHIENPMNERTTKALVVGRLPENRYPDHVLVVVSPDIAQELRALDEQFYVKVRYLQRQSTQ